MLLFWWYNSTNGININFSDISLEEKLYESISVHSISYKTWMDPKSLRIRFDKINGFVRVRCGDLNTYYYLIIDCSIKFVIKLKIF